MSKWEVIIPAHIKQFRYYAFIVVVLSCLEFLSFIVVSILLLRVPHDYLVYTKLITLFADFGLGLITLRFIKNNYPDSLPSVKQQYMFLVLIYLTLFSLIIYLSFVFQITSIAVSLGYLIMGVEFSGELFLSIAIMLTLFLKVICLLLLQIKSFKLVKEIRANFRESSGPTSDLL